MGEVTVKTLLTAVSVLALVSGSAFAADLAPQPTEPVAPVYVPYSWTGFYVGGQLGANILTTKDVIPLYPASFSQTSTGFAIGGKIGGNYQFSNNIVIGAEASALWVTNESDHGTTVPGERYQIKEDYQGSVVARLGYAFDRFLPYVKGGYAFAHLNDLQYLEAGGISSASQDATFNGWTVGAGLDYAVTDHLIVGIDYSYSHYSKKNFFYGGPNSLKPDTNTILGSLSYKF